MGEIKQANFRIDAETADRFRAYCEKEGYNQAQGFDHIMHVLQMAEAKQVIPERLVEIEEFEMHVKAILDGYLRSLETAKNTELRVREDFVSEIAKKDKSIATLENDLEKKVVEVQEAKAMAAEAKEKQELAEGRERQAKELQVAAEKTADDKVAIADMLQVKLAEAESKLEKYPELEQRNIQLDGDLADALRVIKANQKDAEIALERAVNVANQVKDKEIAELRKQMSEALNQAKDEKNAALNQMGQEKNREFSAMEKSKNARITELEKELSKAQTNAEQSQKQADKLESKNDKLQEKVAELMAKVAELTAQNQHLQSQANKKEEK